MTVFDNRDVMLRYQTKMDRIWSIAMLEHLQNMHSNGTHNGGIFDLIESPAMESGSWVVSSHIIDGGLGE